jgi:hypothetical protein
MGPLAPNASLQPSILSFGPGKGKGEGRGSRIFRDLLQQAARRLHFTRNFLEFTAETGGLRRKNAALMRFLLDCEGGSLLCMGLP